MVATMRSNSRKAMALAYAIDEQRQKSRDLCKEVTDAAEAIKQLESKASPLNARCTKRIYAVLAEVSVEGQKETVDAPASMQVRPGLKTDAERLMGYGEELKNSLAVITDSAGRATDHIDIAEREVREIAREARLDRAQQKVASMGERVLRAQELLKATRDERDTMDKIAADIETLSEKMITEERERKRAEAEEKRRKDLERRREADKKTATAQRAAMLAKAATFSFESAMDDLKMGADRYTTDEGRQRYAILVEQCNELIKMKQEIIRRISAKPFTWGWRQGGSPRDISDASPTGVLVGDQNIPWEQIKFPQAKAILNQYICGPNVMPKTQSDHCIAAAIFFAAHDLSEQAEMLIDAGVKMRPALQPKATRLTETILKKH
jgi:hypothetical protein